MENVAHWTAKRGADFVFSVGADFVAQVECKMEDMSLNRCKLADLLSVSDARVSQTLNNPGNIELNTIVNYARVLGMKVSIVLYDDGDTKKEYGPIHPDIFRICWEQAGKPKDVWSFKSDMPTRSVKNYDARLRVKKSAGEHFSNRQVECYIASETKENMMGANLLTAENRSEKTMTLTL